MFFTCLATVATCGGDGSPAAPTPTTSSVAVTFALGGTSFIGDRVQFQATSTLSDGTTQVATDAVWGSDNTAVATVSPTGLVTAVGAGEVTIFADVNPRGTLSFRVFPRLDGIWQGLEIITSCVDYGAYAGACGNPAFLDVGDVFSHNATYTQDDAMVTAVIEETDTRTTTHMGTISIDGELQLPSATGQPVPDDFTTMVQDWRSRADVPAEMTGSYTWFHLTNDKDGEIMVGIDLRDVVRTGDRGGVSQGRGGIRRLDPGRFLQRRPGRPPHPR